MNRRTRRWMSMLLLAMLAFSQATSVLAACAMQRSQLAVMIGAPGHECCDEANSGGEVMPLSANACFSHATADLQVLGSSLWVISAPCRSGAIVPAAYSSAARSAAIHLLATPPPKLIPSRILLHSFLI